MSEPHAVRVMSLCELQDQTLDVLKRTIRQFNRAAHEEGLSDGEFIDQVILPLMHSIQTDKFLIRSNRNKE